MLDPYLLAQAQVTGCTIQTLLAEAEVKEYKEDWRKTPIYRQGGKFASNDKSSEGSTAEKSDSGSAASKMKDIADRTLTPLANKIQQGVKKIPSETQQKLAEAANNPDVKKAKEAIGEAFHEFDVEAGEAFDKVANAIQKGQEEEPEKPIESGVDKGVKKAKQILDIAAKNPGHAALGALGGLLMWSGGLNQLQGTLGLASSALSANPLAATTGLAALGVGTGEVVIGKMLWDIGSKPFTKEMQKEQKEEVKTLSGKIEKVVSGLQAKVPKDK
jgi:hypothetical protein